MQRRHLLSCSALLLAGCAGNSKSPTDSNDSTTTSADTAPTTDSETPRTTEATSTESTRRSVSGVVGESVTTDSGTKLTISDCWIQHSVVWANFPDALTVTAREGKRFVFALVAAEGKNAPPLSEFSFSVGSRNYWAEDEWEGSPRLGAVMSDRGGTPYQATDGDTGSSGDGDNDGSGGGNGKTEGWTLFEVPRKSPDEPAIRWQGETIDARWSLTEEQLAAYTAPPPAFEIVSFDVPERVDSTPFEIRLIVRNVGDGDGSFRGVLNQRGVQTLTSFSLPVPAGETRTWSDEFDAEKLALRWEDGTIERTVEIG